MLQECQILCHSLIHSLRNHLAGLAARYGLHCVVVYM